MLLNISHGAPAILSRSIYTYWVGYKRQVKLPHSCDASLRYCCRYFNHPNSYNYKFDDGMPDVSSARHSIHSWFKLRSNEAEFGLCWLFLVIFFSLFFMLFASILNHWFALKTIIRDNKIGGLLVQEYLLVQPYTPVKHSKTKSMLGILSLDWTPPFHS